MAELMGVAEAKRRFSELIDRVSRGERFVISRRGKAAVAVVPPTEQALQNRQQPSPKGLAAVAGALADWPELDEVVKEIYRAREASRDRPAPSFD